MTPNSPVETEVTAALTVRDGELFRRGATHRILSGALHYFRVHPDQWEDRLRRLAAMGANTVDTYVAWNFHERTEGEISFDGWRDLERFVRLAGEVGLDVFLRPSPYICAEWSNGGIPHWLSARVSALRSSDPEFLRAVTAWYDELLPRMVPLQAAHGGSIVAIQLENEYGSFGTDRAYLEFLRDDLIRRGFVELITTADGITPDMVEHGSVDGVMGTFTFGTGVATAVELKPEGAHLMCSEMWGGWFDHWTEQHHVRSAESMVATVNELLAAGGSVSLYMAHGGTNFGLWNGANFDGVIQPTITSYDSDAPIGEDGSLNDKFFALREAFAPFHAGELPPLPAQPTTQPAQSVSLIATASLYDYVMSQPVIGGESPLPQTFEQLGVEDGLVAYAARSWVPAGSSIAVEDLADRATVFADGVRVGTLGWNAASSLELPGGDAEVEIVVVVESLGRINYGAQTGAHKGIRGGVLINGRRFIHGWTHRAVPLSAPVVFDAESGSFEVAPGAAEASGALDVDSGSLGASGALDVDSGSLAVAAGGAAAASGVIETAPGVPDGVARATVNVARVDDAWLAFPGNEKGMVWLNGFLLGRYWSVGPQVTLYAPAPLWREGENEIVVLDVDGLGVTVELREKPEYGPREEFIGS